MDLHFDSSVTQFLNEVSPSLEKEPALHSFILSLAGRCARNGKNVERLVRGMNSDGRLLIAGIQTDDYRVLILSKASPEHAAEFARQLVGHGVRLPGVNGPLPTVEAFAESWTTANNCNSRMTTSLRLFELEKVVPPRACPGVFRAARAEDEDLILRWQIEFYREAMPDETVPPEAQLREENREAILNQQFFIWENEGAPVALVGSKRHTANEGWIAPVYTPPALRGRGYASALVAMVSQRIVDSGKRGMLFTDLANPTSNSIYQQIGYRPVADFKNFLFE